MRAKFIVVSSIALLWGAIAGCSSSSYTKATDETLDITVSILPQEYFVKKIGGDRVNVNVLVASGADPHTYEPKPQQLQTLSEAKAYITVGGDSFEKAWMKRLKSVNSDLLVVDSAKGIKKISEIPHHHHHHHGEETLDPHIWLSPSLVKIQAQNIYDALVKLDSDRQSEYKKNLDEFIAEIAEVDREIRQNLAGIKNRKFIVFHPAWGYFAREYNLEQVPIEIGGQEPSAAELKELIQEAKEENIKVVFAQPELTTKSAQTIAREIGGEVLIISDLDPNWANNLLQVSHKLGEVLSKQGNS
jgi:zinc transport system substrate-binding protein